MAMESEQELNAILARIERRERTARRQTLLYTLIPVVVAAIILVIIGYRINENRKELDKITSALSEKQKELDETKAQLSKATDFKSLAHPLTMREVKKIASRQYESRQGVVLGEIQSLQMMGVSWHLSGQSPTVGFDSPSFAAYVLEQQGISVGELQSGTKISTQLRENLESVNEPAPGDLLFYPGGYVLFYYIDTKNDPFVIGMTPFGIVSLDPNFDKPEAIRRPHY